MAVTVINIPQSIFVSAADTPALTISAEDVLNLSAAFAIAATGTGLDSIAIVHRAGASLTSRSSRL